MVAPIIPGLSDSEVPAILAAAKAAGAAAAGCQLLRLPATVRPVFLDWLERNPPDARARIEARIRSTRGGKLNNSEFGRRMGGQGNMAEQILGTFQVFAKRNGLNRPQPPLDASGFRPPVPNSGQGWLF